MTVTGVGLGMHPGTHSLSVYAVQMNLGRDETLVVYKNEEKRTLKMI